MDFSQRKLSRSEWDSVEKPVTPEEQSILQMIIDGYTNTNIHINTNTSFIGHFKVGTGTGTGTGTGDKQQPVMEQFIYNEYFKELVDQLIESYEPLSAIKIDTKATAQLNSGNKIRFSKINKTKIITDHRIYEYLLLSQTAKLCGAAASLEEIDTAYYYYSLYHLIQNNIDALNQYVAKFVRQVLQQYAPKVKIATILQHASRIIEQNEYLLKYSDQSLYSHQKQIFNLFHKAVARPHLVLYMAPTGTGKTMTPIALAQEYRIIFMCAARHIGLALARAAITMGRKIAFAFGCDTANDVRLHYSAAAIYTTNTRTGGIKSVDNSVGHKVEIMICDVKSYIPAMNYMLAHNPAHRIITYWDEPTILLDIPEHDMHSLIQQNWSKNKIPNMVLSSATLPSTSELRPVINDFIQKNPGTHVETIHSYDCKKSIPLVDTNGFIVAPHYLAANAQQLTQMCRHCEQNPTLLRYLDLQSVSNFIGYVNGHPEMVTDIDLLLANTDWFQTFDALTMNNIKMYYLKLAQFIEPIAFQNHQPHFMATREHYYNPHLHRTQSMPAGAVNGNTMASQPITRTQSMAVEHSGPTTAAAAATAAAQKSGTSGVYITTKDAHTLTDGPTIFIANDIKKIIQFCIQQANIPEAVMLALTETIAKNNVILEQITELQKTIDDTKDETTAATTGTAAKANARKHNRTFALEENDAAKKTSKTHLTNTINELRTRIKTVQLNNVLIPNKTEHLQRWGGSATTSATAFTSNINEEIVTKILNIDGLENYWKILLLMGIGVFMNMDGAAYNSAYMEIMKELAAEQKLYLIIASSDYIYGTNYQFCHGYLSKDLTDTMTQEKIIQALGRIGRNNIQQHYSARFRDDGLFVRLFTPDHNKPEVANMCRLFSTSIDDLM